MKKFKKLKLKPICHCIVGTLGGKHLETRELTLDCRPNEFIVLSILYIYIGSSGMESLMDIDPHTTGLSPGSRFLQ